MAFWLAKDRRGQDRDWIRRFDPRFWTVDFPRPAMASVVTTAPDALRVECEFHKKSSMVGLIWASEDTLDHPLLAYETRRDYAHCVLRFRWKSSGLVALDQPNGPTLTIEGRDAGGAAKTWFVRLWNYATGTPTDAQVELRFSDLAAGWALPGEAVWPHAIDRMFVSLVPPGFVANSSDFLTARVNGWVEMSGITCEGENAMLPIGDVILPAHGTRIATAYDDSYNQTPARLLRSAEALGYRGSLVHYMGMSHAFRLRRFNDSLVVTSPGALCQPAAVWHGDFFARAIETGFAPVASLSFEILAENCPLSWQQRSHNGGYAQTGWIPPSALVSPTSGAALDFLKGIASQTVGLMKTAGAPVRFQLGEPWWWIIPATGAPCIYDSVARAAYAPGYPLITDMREPMDAAKKAVLDKAGELLGAATTALAQAVRSAAGSAGAEVMLLAFTPTVCDPAMPEAYRANLPLAWAYPAFDRLQLEDYDWITGGAIAKAQAARSFVQARLAYPLAKQDYLAGFVLDPADAETLWPRIDAALDAAQARGIADCFVWALPQVARDGYTRLPPPEEEDVQAFDDVAYPLALGRDAAVSPEFSTSVAVTASGHERRNALWSDARLRFDVGPGIRSQDELATLIAFFRARYGPARGFRLRDPFDFSSNGMTGTPTASDQFIGTGDGVTADFPLTKCYGEQRRRITRPLATSVLVSVDNNALTSGWTIGEGGTIRFSNAPPVGAKVCAGFLFDVPVRFAEDRLDVSGLSFAAGEAPSVPLVEIREAS